MTTFDTPKSELLAQLLPRQYRIDHSDALDGVLSAVGEQWTELEQQLDALYDDLFLVTCRAEVVPYFAENLNVPDFDWVCISDLSSRSWVGRLIDLRRHLGTSWALVEGLRAATGWGISLDHEEQLVARLVDVSFPPTNVPRTGTVDIGESVSFAATTHPSVVDVSSGPAPKLAQLGVWRLRSFPISGLYTAALTGNDVRPGCFTFNPLGIDQPLFRRGESTAEPGGERSDTSFDHPLSRSVLASRLARSQGVPFAMYRREANGDLAAVQTKDMVAGDLSSWRGDPAAAVTVDPELGRFCFSGDEPDVVIVDYAYGLAGALGAGPSGRSNPYRAGETVAVVRADAPEGSSAYATIDDAIEAIVSGADSANALRIDDSTTHRAPAARWVLPPQVGTIMAGPGCMPHLVGDIVARLDLPSRVSMTGIVLDGAVMVEGTGTVAITCCTIVPRLRPALELRASSQGGLAARIDQSIVGSIAAEGVTLSCADSVVDAGGGLAIDGEHADSLVIERSTVLGAVNAPRVVANRSIVTGDLGLVHRDQLFGAFVWARNISLDGSGDPVEPSIGRPTFTSTRFGQPGYAQLTLSCPRTLLAAGPEQIELGVWSALEQAVRAARVQTVLRDFLPTGLDARLVFRT